METLIAIDKVGKHQYRIVKQEADERLDESYAEYYYPIIRIQRQDSCFWIKFWTTIKSYKCKDKRTISIQIVNARKWFNKHLNDLRNGKF